MIVQGVEDRKNGTKRKIKEIALETFLKLITVINQQIQEAQHPIFNPNKVSAKKITSKNNTVKLLKIKEKETPPW